MSKRTAKPIEELFWRHVVKTEKCWIWVGGGSGPRGQYGGFNKKGKKVKTHRLSYELAYGPIDPEICVLHKCDTPRCVRPDHLFLGTRLDNSQDMLSKNRHYTVTNPEKILRGSGNGQAKLTEKQVFQLRRLRLKGVSYHRMGKWLGMDRASIRRAVNGQSWNHVPFPINTTDTLELHSY